MTRRLSAKVQQIPKPVVDDKRRSFEEWLKISADNKINVNNTWNLALIDYFADMTLLRDGDSINFQKASCTLDGCIKIYTSRIDSVDSDTKKLINGLIESKTAIVDEDTIETAPSNTKRKKRIFNSLETEEALNIKSFDLEYDVDPLFKKTAADFDEGGAKGLLLNHLFVSPEGQVIFDASDFNSPLLESEKMISNEPIVGQAFLDRFAPQFTSIWGLEICPSFSKFKFNSDNPDAEFDFQIDTNNLVTSDFVYNSEVDDNDHNLPYDFDDEQRYIPEEDKVDFRESFRMNPAMSEAHEDDVNEMFAYFDNNMSRRWAGPDFWKTRSIKDSSKPIGTAASARKKAKPLEVDFSEVIDEKELFAKSKNGNMLSKATLKQRDEHLLPVDMQFNSKTFTSLFLKPSLKIKVGTVKVVSSTLKDAPANSFNENYQEAVDVYETIDEAPPEEVEINDSSHFNHLEDDMDVIDDSLLPPTKSYVFEQGVKVEPLNFARKATRVDVQKLKENIWTTMEQKSSEKETNFSELVQSLDTIYPETHRADISVPFCFICLLHLANEQGLTISGGSNLNELKVIKG